jgi:phosphoribosylanthranilate isomerase
VPPVPTLVKICGITSPEDARAAAEAGASAIGLVFWSRSPRAVDLPTARRIAAGLSPFVLRVGVFVDEAPGVIARVADSVGLDLVQLHGDEPPEAIAALPRRALKAVRVGAGFRPEDALRYAGHAAGLLFDTGEAGLPGGTGRAFDWTVLASVRDRLGFVALAGGLTPDNVATAIRAGRPDAVDVSSGVETAPGRKDPAKMRAFVAAVRSAGA